MACLSIPCEKGPKDTTITWSGLLSSVTFFWCGVSSRIDSGTDCCGVRDAQA